MSGSPRASRSVIRPMLAHIGDLGSPLSTVGDGRKSRMASMTSPGRSACGLCPARSMIRRRAFGIPAASCAWCSGGNRKSSRPASTSVGARISASRSITVQFLSMRGDA